jgi:hypothetical protein
VRSGTVITVLFTEKKSHSFNRNGPLYGVLRTQRNISSDRIMAESENAVLNLNTEKIETNLIELQKNNNISKK